MTSETITKEKIEEYRLLVQNAIQNDTFSDEQEDLDLSKVVFNSDNRGFSTLVRLIGETPQHVTVQYASCYHRGKKNIIPWHNVIEIKWDRRCTGYELYFIVTKTQLS